MRRFLVQPAQDQIVGRFASVLDSPCLPHSPGLNNKWVWSFKNKRVDIQIGTLTETVSREPVLLTDTDRLTVLHRFYRIHDRFAATLDSACRKGCRTCCTRNLTLTTLEGAGIIDHLITIGRADLRERVVDAGAGARFTPEVTTNGLAGLWSRGEEPPEEVTAPLDNACPLLENDLCTVYPSRPLGCRSLISTTPCRLTGFAEADPLTLTLNTVFLQFTEHLDQGGYSGNLTDILLYLWRLENGTGDGFAAAPPEHLLTNLPIPMLLVPPAERAAVTPWITALEQAAFIDKR